MEDGADLIGGGWSWRVLKGVWQYAGQAATQAGLSWFAASAKCKGAIVFSAYHVFHTCGGYEAPVQYTPGFGPFALAWGWSLISLVLGILFGITLCAHFWTFVARIEQLCQKVQQIRTQVGSDIFAPPGLSLLPPWHQAVQNALSMAADGNRRIILQRLAEDGDAALDLLAASYGVTKRDALTRILGDHVVRPNAAAWGL